VKKQCATCPFKKGTNPFDIPGGYSAEKHAALGESTIADPDDPYKTVRRFRVMACHLTPIGDEKPCIGWLHNQNEASNLGLRLAIHEGLISLDYELDGPQHATFEDTLPEEMRDGTAQVAAAQTRRKGRRGDRLREDAPRRIRR
jgi:hypothetical protein